MTAKPDPQLFPRMDRIRGQLVVANLTSPKVLLQSVLLEAVELLAEAQGKYEVVINPGQSHSLDFECSSPALHTKLHLVRIQYTREEDSIEYVDKVNFFLPLLPFVKYNANTLVTERLETLWAKITVGWRELVSPQILVDRDFFANSHDIQQAFPCLRIASAQFGQLESGQVPAPDQADNEYCSLLGFFQISDLTALMVLVAWISPSSLFLHFKYPDVHDDLVLFELAAIMNHLCFVFSDHSFN
jgi:hypothetical protein